MKYNGELSCLSTLTLNCHIYHMACVMKLLACRYVYLREFILPKIRRVCFLNCEITKQGLISTLDNLAFNVLSELRIFCHSKNRFV